LTKEILARDAKRDIGAEVLEAIREIKAGDARRADESGPKGAAEDIPAHGHVAIVARVPLPGFLERFCRSRHLSSNAEWVPSKFHLHRHIDSMRPCTEWVRRRKSDLRRRKSFMVRRCFSTPAGHEIDATSQIDNARSQI
jgi:hypothetical protein